MTISSDVQKLNPGAVVEMFELDATSFGGEIFRFHNGVNELGNDIVWQGETYLRFPIEASGFELKGGGTLPRPVLRIANVTGLIGALVREFDGLVNAKLTRRRTFLQYLDAVNFADGNPGADPNVAFPDEIWFIDRKASEDAMAISFELSTPWDVAGITLPRRQFIQNVCPFKYRGAECGYAGDPVADKNDGATSDPDQDRCGKRISSCKLRFGEFEQLPFGGFPAVGLIR